PHHPFSAADYSMPGAGGPKRLQLILDGGRDPSGFPGGEQVKQCPAQHRKNSGALLGSCRCRAEMLRLMLLENLQPVAHGRFCETSPRTLRRRQRSTVGLHPEVKEISMPGI